MNMVSNLKIFGIINYDLSKYDKLNITYPLKGVEAMDKAKCEELERILLDK